MTGVKSVKFDLWESLSSINKAAGNTTKAAIIAELDAILSSKGVEALFNAVIIANNTASLHKDIHGTYVANTNNVTGTLLNALNTVKDKVMSIVPKATELINKACAMPNIAGIPISSAKVETNKEVEVSESMVIVQSKHTKQYWTDNAVPRLKEWIVSGYLTSTSPLDSGLQVKPSLKWQIYYLTVCADSRRPVMFKTNQGEFVKVQITNLHTVEEASYNNVIEVTASLKEYNPYFIQSNTGDNEIAVFEGAR